MRNDELSKKVLESIYETLQRSPRVMTIYLTQKNYDSISSFLIVARGFGPVLYIFKPLRVHRVAIFVMVKPFSALKSQKEAA